MVNMKEATSETLVAPTGVDMSLVTGPADRHLRLVQERFDARITVRGDEIAIVGDPAEVDSLKMLFNDLFRQVAEGGQPTESGVLKLVGLMRAAEMSPEALRNDVVLSYKGKAIRPKSAGQKRFLDAIRTNSITFGLGPAGTGKTFLTCAMAVAALNAREVGRIVLTRPIVEAGESLGFLPARISDSSWR